jgi:hypothetical protein
MVGIKSNAACKRAFLPPLSRQPVVPRCTGSPVGCPPGRALASRVPLGLGGSSVCSCAVGWRPDEQYFCWTGLHANAPYTVNISCYLQATTNESNHKDHEAHRGRTETSRRDTLGTFDPLPYPKSRDNHLIAAGSPVGCLGEGGLPTGPGLASGCRSGSGARLRTLVCGRRRPVGQTMRLAQGQTAVKIQMKERHRSGKDTLYYYVQ